MLSSLAARSVSKEIPILEMSILDFSSCKGKPPGSYPAPSQVFLFTTHQAGLLILTCPCEPHCTKTLLGSWRDICKDKSCLLSNTRGQWDAGMVLMEEQAEAEKETHDGSPTL